MTCLQGFQMPNAKIHIFTEELGWTTKSQNLMCYAVIFTRSYSRLEEITNLFLVAASSTCSLRARCTALLEAEGHSNIWPSLFRVQEEHDANTNATLKF
uniref:Uncharacterized protein n=1 Tax=Rhizophora mucronata TaxID=61149 RepID=A0A2P2QU14_RHIMU